MPCNSGICKRSNNTINFFKQAKNSSIPTDDTYILVGAPNVGKSTFFNKITWQNSPVGNIDRITVTSKMGALRVDKKIKIMDVPGIYNLNPTGYDENVTTRAIFDKKYFSCINIVSATSLKRDLILTTQLLESGVVKQIIINRIDEFYDGEINAFKLGQKLKTKVELVSALKNTGIKAVAKNLMSDLQPNIQNFKITYPNQIEEIIKNLIQYIPDKTDFSKRFLAIQYLEANVYIQQLFSEWKITDVIDEQLAKSRLTIRQTKQIIKLTRKEFVSKILSLAIKTNVNLELASKNTRKIKIQKYLDKIFLNKWLGILMFIFVIIGIYYLSFGNYAGGYINEVWTSLLEQGQDAVKEAIQASMGEDAKYVNWVQNFVADGLLGGIFTAIGFIPYIIIMFFLINLVEQTGYLARVSLILDKQFEKFGISGKSVITLITGIGCNIPAVMMARNCHSLKERTVVFMIAPFMACSARLIVFIWIANVIVSTNYAWLLGVAFTFFSGFITLAAGLLFSKTMFRNSHTFLLTELPSWQLPDLFIVTKKVSLEVFDFVKRVTTIIFLVNFVMFFLMYISPTIGLIDDLSILSNQHIDWTKASLLQYISLPFQYLFYPIGLGEDWRFSTSLLAASPAKELAASNISLLFNGIDEVDDNTAMGFVNALFSEQSSVTLPIATLASYLVMFSFYTPCLSTTVVMKKEGGTKNTFIHLVAALVLSYLLCLVFYVGIGSVEKILKTPSQSLLLATNPLAIIAWILIVFGFSALTISFLIKQHINNTKQIVTVKTTNTFYLIYIISSSIMLVGLFFMLCFMFIY